MSTFKIICVAGARPNFVKIAPLMRAIGKRPQLRARLVHTGQHYDDALSRVFFDELQIPRADLNLDVGSGSHATQTAEIMRRFEPVVNIEQPQAVLVVGDVNSTIACALVTAKIELAAPFAWRGGRRRRPLVIHVEAGLRSFDDDMPEEINRRLTDSISDLLFTTEASADKNLRAEGVADERIHFVGNVMIDTLQAARQRAMALPALESLGLTERGYALLTLHRPSNVDKPGKLREILATLDEISRMADDLPIVFPIHPRTRAALAAADIELGEQRWRACKPVGYLEFIKLMACARLVLSDSGGIQEETTVLGVPCLTLRENTERPVTIEQGTNILAGTTRDAILAAHAKLGATAPSGRIPELWDGQAAERIADILVALAAGH